MMMTSTSFLAIALLPLAASALTLRAGSVTPANLTDSDPVVNFAFGKIMEFNAQRGIVDPAGFQLTSATQQVVAGALYNLTFDVMTLGQRHMECNVAVWYRVWLTGDDKMQVSGKPGCKDLATKRQLLAGGVTNADVHSAEVLGALAFAVKEMNSRENNMYYRKQTGDFTVTKQVVAGMRYEFSGVQMANTDCTKSQSNPDLDSCNISANANTQTCKLTVIHQAWATPEYQLLGFDGSSCQ